MESTDSNHNIHEFSVTRNYSMSASSSIANVEEYYETDVFDVVLDRLKTAWKIIICRRFKKLYACLHKVSSSSNDFTMAITYKNNSSPLERRFDGQLFKNGEWILVPDFHGIQFTLREKPICLHEAQFDEQREELLLSESFNDFKFICADEKTVLANRAILALNSSVFRVMLDAQMLESKTQTAKLEDIDSKTMQEVIRFLYTRRIDDIKTHAVKLLYCADKYELRDLRSFCVAAMTQNMSTENVIEYLIAANRYKENDLIRRCLFYIEREIIDKEKLEGLDQTLFNVVSYLIDKKEKSMPLRLAFKKIASYNPPP